MGYVSKQIHMRYISTHYRAFATIHYTVIVFIVQAAKGWDTKVSKTSGHIVKLDDKTALNMHAYP